MGGEPHWCVPMHALRSVCIYSVVNFVWGCAGATRARGSYAWRTLLDSGARLALGSDFVRPPPTSPDLPPSIAWFHVRVHVQLIGPARNNM